jgi:pilus assembly protein FimV
MVSTSKILTVSYGTFSCTLEGFDDSFETMKAIAEYFRDLAAEDRYFGAEPPVPDAEMLARIAEREIARRVEAREERGSIVLRAAPYGAVAAPLAPQPAAPFAATPAPAQPQPVAQPAAEAPAAAPMPAAVPAPAAPAMTEAEDEAEAWEDVPLEDVAPRMEAPAAAPLRATPVPHPDPDSVAAKLQRIRDVVTKTAAAPAPEAYSEDEHAENFLAAATASIETALAQDDATAAQDEEEEDEIAALLSRLAGEQAPAAEVPAAPLAPQIEADEQDEAQEDLTQEAIAAADDTAADLDDDVADDLDDDVAEDMAADDLDDEELVAAADRAAADDLTDAATMDSTDQDIADQDSDARDDAAAALPGRVIKIKREDFDAAIARGELVAEDDTDTDAAEPEAVAEAPAPAPRAEGLRLRADADLSPEQEDDLRRELAAVEAELVDIYSDTEDHAAPRATSAFDDDADDDDLTSLFDEDDAEEADQAEDAAARDTSPLVLRDPREQLVKVRAEDDMSRLMARAESAMTEPESASRRNAIAHLRAAVAATKAEHSAGNLPNREPAASAFRDDLASVVRPRRPVGEATTATPRPAETRPAPLKLVAEQRVDLPLDHASSPVRPRRVSLAPMADDSGLSATASSAATAPSAASAAEGEFADFARKMSATALPDLLEAAAAYLVHVEGRAEFSRPQLMNKARQGADATLSREDGLRAFGQLLRQGKIQKIRGGRFTAAEDIGFNPAARRAG